MHRNHGIARVGAMLLAGMISTQAFALLAPKVDNAWVSGTLQSGGTAYYRAVVTTRPTGRQSLTASINVPGWRATFPLVAITPNGVAAQTVTSRAINIPPRFTGSVLMVVNTVYNSRVVGRKTVRFNVTPPAGPQTTLYDVGFDTQVSLDAAIANTSSLATNRTYTWTQLSGPAAVLSASNVASPTFRTLPIESLLPLDGFRFGIATNYTVAYITNSTVSTVTNAVVTSAGGIMVTNMVAMTVTNFAYVTTNYPSYTNVPLSRRPVPGVVGINTHEVNQATYKFKVLISDGVNTTAATQTVVACSTSLAQKDLPIGLKAYLQSVGSTNEVSGDLGTNGWTLVSSPVGSGITTLGGTNSLAPYLQPDVEGVYVVSNSISQTSLVLTGAKWVGVATCAMCHGPNPVIAEFAQPDSVSPWSLTPHATKFQRQLDRQQGSYYSESCIACHTVGNNKTPTTAGNGGFDDIAKNIGWTFPTSMKLGNYNQVPAELKDVSNIQCENCHGPGSNHPGPKSVSLDNASCNTCHQDGSHHERPEQWENSGHFHTDNYVEFNSPANNPGCAKCHSPGAFVDSTSGTLPPRTGLGKHGCAVCHDPHNKKGYEKHLRIYDTVKLDDHYTVTGAGASALCMYCHNARRSADTKSSGAPYYRAEPRGFSHESTAENIYHGRSGVQHGIPMGTSAHTLSAGCVDCHMGPNPNGANHNKLGDHTFKVAYTDGNGVAQENLAACNACHEFGKPVDKLDFVFDPNGDYDGDGTVEGVQSEVIGLKANVDALLVTSGLSRGTSYPWQGWANKTTYPVLNEAQHAAAWNSFLVERDGSHGIHNTQYTVALLQHSYAHLKNVVDGTTGMTYKDYFPSAVLR